MSKLVEHTSEEEEKVYQLVDCHGDGILMPWIKYARQTNDYGVLDEYLETVVKSFLYNGGKGKLISISELVMIRNKQRNAMLSALLRKKGRGKCGPNILDDINQEGLQKGDVIKAIKILDGCIKDNRSMKYRELIWDITLRGLSPLHQAIVNEDIEMVYFLLKNNADVHQRCYGSFFCADDQRASRTDSLEHEWVDVVQNTRYTGSMYWGEYPLSFAACTNQHDCFRLLRAFNADPNMRDTNGNTVLHLAEMFTLAYNLGAKLDVRNEQKLTPMALAAKLAKKEMFDLILEIESDVLWNYGQVKCTAFPLGDIDSVNERTGHLNHASVLPLDKSRHLDFLDGLLEDLLEAKWNAFGRKKFLISLANYIVYVLSFYIAFMTRRFAVNKNATEQWPDQFMANENMSDDWALSYEKPSMIEIVWEVNSEAEQCHLWRYDNHDTTYSQTIRLTCECIILILALTQSFQEVIDIRRSGHKRWWRVMSAFPSELLHKLSFAMVLLIVVVRYACSLHPMTVLIENFLAIIAVLTTSMHFLFYCRGVKFVGPFVLMVYKIIVGDILRFFLIYLIFVIGFSQG
ncbi:unnamed protein product [Anisakis simplex]|uniref:ANK_REP_REGION domain-containing protein n=1 Tax=Anisakis simplex TaxID=6269 RepID=A0A158PP39_ANISI|nr:unnamed protein product [Anisakis simplex]